MKTPLYVNILERTLLPFLRERLPETQFMNTNKRNKYNRNRTKQELIAGNFGTLESVTLSLFTVKVPRVIGVSLSEPHLVSTASYADAHTRQNRQSDITKRTICLAIPGYAHAR